jgi:hypothetical protein
LHPTNEPNASVVGAPTVRLAADGKSQIRIFWVHGNAVLWTPKTISCASGQDIYPVCISLWILWKDLWFDLVLDSL